MAGRRHPLPGFPFHWRGELRSLAAGDIDDDGDGAADIFATQDNAYNSLHHGTGEAFDCVRCVRSA